MTTIKLRRGTASEWTTANPILAAGEMGIETDTRKFKFGDGTTPWNTLAYASAEGGGGAGDVTAAGDNYFTGNNTFTGTTKFDNDVNIHGANLEVAGTIKATTGNITNLQVPNTLTSSGEINAVSIKSTGIRSDDIQTTANKKYLTEVDVDNQTIQMVDGKLHANLDTKQDILVDGNGTKVVDNKVDIYQGDAGLQGLSFYQNNGTITKNNDESITFNNGACGYIFLENKGVNNDYEIILHQNYLGTHGTERDSSINGVRCLPQDVVPTPGEGAQGECWFDTYESPFRVVAVSSDGNLQTQIVDNTNYVKYIIKGTNLTVSYSSTGETYTELYTIAISSTYVINVCIANSPWQNDITNKWTNTTLYSDSYVLDKTTNTYLMKLGVTSEGVAVATSNKYGLVLPDNSTIVSNNGVLSSIAPNNVVTTDTEQTITGTKTFNKLILPENSRINMPTNGIFSSPTSKFASIYKNSQGKLFIENIQKIDTVNLGCRQSLTIGSNNYSNRAINFLWNKPGYTGYLSGLSFDNDTSKLILSDDNTITLDINATKVLFNSPTLARKVDDSTEATIIDSNNISKYIPQSGGVTIKDTFVDGTSGYRIWTDGYCEQWGYIARTGNYVTITFLKAFKDTNYNIACNTYISNTGAGAISFENIGFKVISNTQMQIKDGSDNYHWWRASGYLAEGQY